LSVRLSVCPIDQQQQQRVAGLLLSALWAGYIDRQLRARSAANAGSVMSTWDRGDSTQTWLVLCCNCRATFVIYSCEKTIDLLIECVTPKRKDGTGIGELA